MITVMEISGVHYEVDETTRKYVTNHIGKLDKYLPRHARESVSVEVRLSQVNQDHGNKYQVEVTMTVPHQVIVAKDSTLNMLAAVDIVEAKLVAQLRKYKSAARPF